MPRHYHYPVGYIPRAQSESEGRRALYTWLTRMVANGTLPDGRRPMRHPWSHTDIHAPSGCLCHIHLTLWNFMEIPIVIPGRSVTDEAARRGSTRGYVTCFEISYEYAQRGSPWGPFATGRRVPEGHVSWEVVRCLPETDRQALVWGYDYANRTQWEVILRECQRYNTTLRSRLLSCYTAGRAHRSAVCSMERQSVELIYQAAFELALAAGSSGADNPAPWFSEVASRAGVRLHWQRGDTIPRLVRE